jgi:hypothetical protein
MPLVLTSLSVPENVKFQDDFAIPAYREKLATPLPRRLVDTIFHRRHCRARELAGQSR